MYISIVFVAKHILSMASFVLKSHCGKKMRDLQIIFKALYKFSFLLLATNYVNQNIRKKE
jgi:hypothetical protein